MAKRKVTQEKQQRRQRASRLPPSMAWEPTPVPVCTCGHYAENHGNAPRTWCLHGGCPCEAYDRKEGS